MSDIRLRPARLLDLAFITSLERHSDNRGLIGQWSDEEHLAAIGGRDRWSHWIIERAAVPAGFLIARDCVAEGAGVYIKRILITEKERGTGQAALQSFAETVFGETQAPFVWLIVRNGNARAEAVYRKVGFQRFEPGGEEAQRLDAVAEAPQDRSFRMRLKKA